MKYEMSDITNIQEDYRGARLPCKGTVVFFEREIACSVCDKPEPVVKYELVATFNDDESKVEYGKLREAILGFNFTQFHPLDGVTSYSVRVTKGNIVRILMRKTTDGTFHVHADWMTGLED